jgi:hypothetical protein
MTAKQAAPISFTTASFGDLTEPPNSYTPVGDPPQLDSIYLEYGNVLSRIRRIEEILGNRNGRFRYVTDQQVQYLNTVRRSLAAHLSQLNNQAIQCNQPQGNCNFPDIDSQIINWPLLPEENCSSWKDGWCIACEIPISFMAQLTGATFNYTCTHMPDGADVNVKFDGLFITVSASEPDNKVWNTWIAASVKGLSPCSKCTMARVSPGLGGGGPANATQYNRYWQVFDFEGKTKASSGNAQVQLVIDKCQAGDHLTTCDSSPPGTGSNHAQDDITNRGFPGPYPPPQAKVRFVVPQN